MSVIQLNIKIYNHESCCGSKFKTTGINNRLTVYVVKVVVWSEVT